MTDRFRRMPVAAEVNAFEGEVGGDQDVCGLTCEGGLAQDGAVVADARLNARDFLCALLRGEFAQSALSREGAWETL